MTARAKSRQAPEGLSGRGLRVAVACARFNEDVTERLLQGATEVLSKAGVADDAVTVVWVPGAFELPLAAQRLANTNDAVVCLGAVIRGETPHFDFVAGECASGLQRVALDTGKPIAFGVLTTETREQALDRAGGAAGNKGEEAALSAVEMSVLLADLKG